MDRHFLKSVHAQNLQDPGQTVVDGEGLFETGHEKVGADGDPNLGSDSIVGCAEEGLDPQVLLDPFEEEFDLPSALVDQRDSQCRDRKVVGKEDQVLAGFFVEEVDSTQGNGISFLGESSAEPDCLVAAQPGIFGDLARLPDMEVEIALGPNDEERSGLSKPEETGEIEVSTIHYIDGSGSHRHPVEEGNIVFPSLRNVDKQRDRALQIHLRMNLHGSFGFAEVRPGKERQAQVDSARVDSDDHAVQTDGILLCGIEALRFSDENLGQGFVNPPVSPQVGVGQIAPGDVAAKPHPVSILVPTQASLDVPQPFPVSQLREDHREELIPGRELRRVSAHRVQFDATVELLPVQIVDNLCEYEPSSVHPLLRTNTEKGRQPIQMRDNLFSS